MGKMPMPQDEAGIMIQTSQLEITNIALTLLGVEPLTAITDQTQPGRASLLLFDPARLDVLRSYSWRFARERAILPKLARAPLFGFSFAYQLPWDYIGCPVPDIDGVPYSIESQEYLINDDETLGANLAVNGVFAADTNWTKGTGWTIAGGVAACSGAQTAVSTLSQAMSLTEESWYKIGYTLAAVTAGKLTVKCGSSGFRRSVSTPRTASGPYVEALLCRGNSTLYFEADADFIGNLDNVTIQTIVAAPGLFYVRDASEITVYPYDFAQALAACLAYQLTFALTNTPGKRSEMFDLYHIKINQAKLGSAREGSPKTQRPHSWLAKRK
jgi:hypothetical protein